eukprot:TRINITY_DN1378_c0_g1_i19.p1 TRINITY_DN1378_c0_g1~~TRINITY_DN1378_c0_g1_i19.p1  ORF type:complete len:118 (-),score=1.43 TRINITY_DN1378_c0_g1_i19:528-881(-)
MADVTWITRQVFENNNDERLRRTNLKCTKRISCYIEILTLNESEEGKEGHRVQHYPTQRFIPQNLSKYQTDWQRKAHIGVASMFNTCVSEKKNYLPFHQTDEHWTLSSYVLDSFRKF